MKRRRQLVGETTDHRDVLDGVGGAFMVLQLEQPNVAVAEAHRQYDDAEDVARARLEPPILSRIGYDHCLPGLEGQPSQSHSKLGWRMRGREKAER